MPVTQLLLGTRNPRKIELYQRYLSDVPVTLVTAKELNIPGPEETANTIESNAALKARYYYELSGLPTLADDAGFEIAALDDFPGAKSHRFARDTMTDENVIQEIIRIMANLKGTDRRARMRIVLVLRVSANEVHTALGSIEGHVPEQPDPRRLSHFPYRSLLHVESLNKSFFDVTDEDEERLGYRTAALRQLKPYLR